MGQYKGRLTYAKGTYVEFAVAPDQDVDFGDILVVEGNNDDRFYIRVYDFKVKSRFSNLNGVGYLMSKLNADGQIADPEQLEFWLGGQHTIKVGMAEQLCYADCGGKLFNPRTCPDFFSQVRGLSSNDADLLKEIKGDLEIGQLKSGRGVMELPVGVYGNKAITEHIGIFGTTGAGKSNLVKVLACSVINNNNYGMLIFDVHNEYKEALANHRLSKDRLKVFNPTPSEPHHGCLQIGAHEIEPEDLLGTAFFTEAQSDALYKMQSVWGDLWFNYVLQYDTSDIIDELEGCTGQKFHPRTVSKIKSICWNLQKELNVTKDNEDSKAMNDILGNLEQGNVVLIELKSVSGMGEQAISTILSKKLLQHYAAKTEQQRSKDKPVMIVLEEAHRFLGKKEQANTNVFARLVSEARKFNIGLCAVDQQPRLLADKVLSQLNTLFILGLASKADRTKLETMCRKDILQQRNEIKNLDCGELIIATNYMRFAVPVKAHKFEDYVFKN